MSIVKIFFTIFSIVFLIYVLIPGPIFPSPISESVQSIEEADTETPLRRAYFTNYDRSEVLSHYQNQFTNSIFYDLYLPTYRLNYPPEDAQMLIRDQTRSTFLEEIVHPFRESLFVNGFKPTEPKDAIGYKGVAYEQKITIKFVPSIWYVRLLVALLTIFFSWLLLNEWRVALKDLFRR